MKKTVYFAESIFKILIHPRKIIRDIIDFDTNFYVWPLLIVLGFFSTFETDLYVPFLGKASLSLLIPMVALASFVLMVGGFWFFCWFVYYFGKSMGGTGTFDQVKVAYIWSSIPGLIGMLFSTLGDAPVWAKIFMGETNNQELLLAPKMWWQGLFAFLYFASIVWTFVLDSIAVSEAHRISMGKSVAINAVAFVISLLVGAGIGVVTVLCGGKI